MANFKKYGSQTAISTVGADAQGKAKFRLWGGGPNGEELVVRVYRAGVVVSESGGVTLASKSAGNWDFDYEATGLKPGDQIFGMTNLDQRYTSALSVVAASAAPSKNHLINTWAKHYDENPTPSSDFLYAGAVPYLALKHKKMGSPKRLAEKCVGGPLSQVYGLAVHTTALASHPAFNMAAFQCVETWNGGGGASAHFGIGNEGTVVQFISADRIANAQHNPGNLNWLSVEVSNNGKAPMTEAQLMALKLLFHWVTKRFGVPVALSTGYHGPNVELNEITTTVCQAGGAQVTTDPLEPARVKGLSCHHWLDKAVKPCPGPGILSQLPSVLKSGPVS